MLPHLKTRYIQLLVKHDCIEADQRIISYWYCDPENQGLSKTYQQGGSREEQDTSADMFLLRPLFYRIQNKMFSKKHALALHFRVFLRKGMATTASDWEYMNHNPPVFCNVYPTFSKQFNLKPPQQPCLWNLPNFNLPVFWNMHPICLGVQMTSFKQFRLMAASNTFLFKGVTNSPTSTKQRRPFLVIVPFHSRINHLWFLRCAYLLVYVSQLPVFEIHIHVFKKQYSMQKTCLNRDYKTYVSKIFV